MLRLTRATCETPCETDVGTNGRAARRSGGGNQPQRHRPRAAARCGAATLGHARMRRAVARAGLARMTAKRDLLSLLVAAIGIAAVASFELNQCDQARPDADAAQFD